MKPPVCGGRGPFKACRATDGGGGYGGDDDDDDDDDDDEEEEEVVYQPRNACNEY